VSRVPIRVRLTLGFALVTAVLLVGAGLFIYSRVASDLDAGIDRGLRARVSDLVALVVQSESGLRESSQPELIESGADFAQVLDDRGRVFDATAGFGRAPLLAGSALESARSRTTIVRRARVQGLHAPARLIAHPVRAQGHRLVVVAGASLEDRDEALSRLRDVMLGGGPVLLLLLGVGGYGLAATALRPVERMRRRAAGISEHRLQTRLPVGGSGDELDRLALTLNESLDRVESAMARQRDFVADASHELRTPLSILRAQLELMLEEHATGTLNSDIESAIEEVDRLATLADDLLLLARADRGDLALAAEPVRVAELLERVAERLRLRAPGDVVVSAAPSPDLWVHGDARRLEQALLNLAENALRHGGGAARLGTALSNGHVELHVVDDGPGFPPGFAATAFERFSQAEPGRSGAGAGLGLAIVKAIAEAHGGTAGFRDGPDGGTDAWLSLPLGEPAGDQAPRYVRAQPSEGW
jgi:signal transduction histidine kinase